MNSEHWHHQWWRMGLGVRKNSPRNLLQIWFNQEDTNRLWKEGVDTSWHSSCFCWDRVHVRKKVIGTEFMIPTFLKHPVEGLTMFSVIFKCRPMLYSQMLLTHFNPRLFVFYVNNSTNFITTCCEINSLVGSILGNRPYLKKETQDPFLFYSA